MTARHPVYARRGTIPRPLLDDDLEPTTRRELLRDHGTLTERPHAPESGLVALVEAMQRAVEDRGGFRAAREVGPVLCPICGAPSWNAAVNPGEPCLRCKRAAREAGR